MACISNINSLLSLLRKEDSSEQTTHWFIFQEQKKYFCFAEKWHGRHLIYVYLTIYINIDFLPFFLRKFNEKSGFGCLNGFQLLNFMTIYLYQVPGLCRARKTPAVIFILMKINILSMLTAARIQYKMIL